MQKSPSPLINIKEARLPLECQSGIKLCFVDMGCGASKIKRIHLSQEESNGHGGGGSGGGGGGTVLKRLASGGGHNGRADSPASSDMVEGATLPNRLLVSTSVEMEIQVEETSFLAGLPGELCRNHFGCEWLLCGPGQV